MPASTWVKTPDKRSAERGDGTKLKQGEDRWLVECEGTWHELYSRNSDELDLAIIAADQYWPPLGWVLLPDGWYCRLAGAIGSRVVYKGTNCYIIEDDKGLTVAICYSAHSARGALEETLEKNFSVI